MPIIYRQKTGGEAVSEILAGVNLINNHVGSTLGPRGELVAIRIADPRGANGHVTMLTKDGVTVAKFVKGETAGQAIGVEIIREASMQTLRKAGDGTTSTVIMAAYIYEQCLIAMGKHPSVERPEYVMSGSELKRGIFGALEVFKKNLSELSKPVDLEGDDLMKVAVVSTNGDKELASLIVDAYKAVEYRGHVMAEYGDKTCLEVVNGARMPWGFLDPSMITDPSRGVAEYEQALVCIHGDTVSYSEGIEKLISRSRVDISKKMIVPILYIAPVINGNTPAALIGNNNQWRMTKAEKGAPIVAIECGEGNAEVLEDIAHACDTVVFGTKSGRTVDASGASYLGNIKKVTVTKDHAIFQFNPNQKLTDRIAELQAAYEVETDIERKARLKERVARLTVGVAVVKIGANSQTEAGEKFDRVDDAIKAVQCAIEEGYVIGGGIGYADCLNEPKTVGENILAAALIQPLIKIKGDGDVTALRAKYEEEGIYDPSKVLREAVTNAVTAGVHLAMTGTFLSNSEAI